MVSRSSSRHSNDKPVVLLVHGLWMNKWFMKALGWRLMHAGFRVEYFSYPTIRTQLDEHVLRLRECILALPGSPRLLGHSLGGLMLLDALAGMKIPQDMRLMLLGSPIQGSQVARDFSASVIGKRLLGGSAERLQQVTTDLPKGLKVGAVVGTLRLGLSILLPGKRAGISDGAVFIDEAQSPELDMVEASHVNHVGLLFSARVARRVIQFYR